MSRTLEVVVANPRQARGLGPVTGQLAEIERVRADIFGSSPSAIDERTGIGVFGRLATSTSRAAFVRGPHR